MTTSKEMTERDAFEAWARQRGHDVVSRLETGGKFYVSSFTRHAWAIWQAASASLPPPSAEPVPKHSVGLLGELLARIHRDGGQRQWDVGTEQAVMEADEIVAKLFAASPPIQVAPSDDTKRLNAYAALVKAKEGQIAHLQAELTKHDEAVNTLASEREANALLTAEVEALRAAAPVPQVAPEQMQAELDRAKRALIRAGFEDCGGQEWAPPIGPAPRFIEVAPEQASVRELEASMWRMKKLPIWDNLSHPLHLELDVMLAAIRALISKEAAPSADSAADARLVMQGMADCMDMVRGELIEAGIIGENVAPMFIANAVCARIAGSEQDAARYQWLVERFGVARLPCFLEDSFQRGYIADGKKSIDSAIDTAMQPATGKEPT